MPKIKLSNKMLNIPLNESEREYPKTKCLCVECGNTGNVGMDCVLWACPECQLIQRRDETAILECGKDNSLVPKD